MVYDIQSAVNRVSFQLERSKLGACYLFDMISFTDYDPVCPDKYITTKTPYVVERDARTVDYEGDGILFTQLPHTRLNATQCVFKGGKTKRYVLSLPEFPASVPIPDNSTYTILSTPNIGMGMFAARALKVGDLICGERPLLVVPQLSGRGMLAGKEMWETMLHVSLMRMDPENQAKYRALYNCHDDDSPLLGIVRTNGFGIPIGSDADVHDTSTASEHTAVFDHLSRVNHRCVDSSAFRRCQCS